MLDGIDEHGEHDVVLLLLHGGMIADGYLDCEGDLLENLRDRIGPEPCVGVVLDPHCHLTNTMLTHADILVCAKEYPHTDFPERMADAYDICVRAIRGEVRPVPAVFDCRMIGFFPTTTPMMKRFVERLYQAENEPGVLSASFVHGFELGDTPDTGSKVLVYTDGDRARAVDIATKLGIEVYSRRFQLLPCFAGMDETLQSVKRAKGIVVLADIGDNPGAGCAGDNMGLVRGLMEAGVSGVTAGCIWDPMVVRICASAGRGARLRVRLGGKSGPASGPPLDLEVEVVNVLDNHQQEVFDTGKSSFGQSVWLRSGSLDLVVGSVRSQVLSTDAFTGIGINLGEKRVIVVKSGQHFYRSFSPLADTILYPAAPHTIGLDLRSIPHRYLDHEYFPRVDDPLGLGRRERQSDKIETESTSWG